jgi:N-acetyl-alpha-D-muramate 1-phosphate uridylyltransferase
MMSPSAKDRHTSVAILAGGLATRLRPLTDDIPKAMVPILGRPFLEHQLELLREHGLTRVVLCLGYRGAQVQEHFGDGSRFGVELEYSYDGPTLLGTGGALRQALPLLSDPFVVLYGDSYLLADYAGVIRAFTDARGQASPPLGLMTVFENRDERDRSNVIFRDGAIEVYDKQRRDPEMRHIDWGLGLLTKAAFDHFPTDAPFDLADVYAALVRARRLLGYEVSQRFYEAGSFDGIRDLEAFLAARDGARV